MKYKLVSGLLKGVSLLPFPVLYFFSDIFYGLVFYVIGYRKKVVLSNLEIAFPEKTKEERVKIAKQFYKNFIDSFIESIKCITLSDMELTKRATGEFDLINEQVKKGKNVHIMAAHQFNWEYANLIFAKNLFIPYVGIYMPISNKILDKIFFNFRKRNGTILISATDFKNKMHTVFQKQYIVALAADQNPGDPSNAFWMPFFTKLAPFVTGPGKGAVKNNTAVFMVGIRKIKRGYYHFPVNLITEEGINSTPEKLTVLYKESIEKIIQQDPANYLWSHRRWKYDWNENYPKPVVN